LQAHGPAGHVARRCSLGDDTDVGQSVLSDSD
jgi:hypothetical protein